MALLWQFVRQDFVDRFSGSVLGVSWAIALPIAQILLFTLIFANIFAARLPGIESVYAYGIYLVCGILPWNTFTSTVSRVGGLLLDKRGIVTKIPLSLISFLLYAAVTEALILAVVMTLFVAVLALTGHGLGPSLLALPLVFLLQQALAFALGLCVAVGSIFVRDLRDALGVIFQFWFWSTPIVYVPEILPAPVAALQMLNPAYWFVSGYQNVIVFGAWPDPVMSALLVAVSVSLLAAAVWILHRAERAIRDTL